jgi:transposase
MPAKADKEKQTSFRGAVLLPLIEKAKNGLCELYFLDASHFVMGGFAGRIWGKFRVWVKTGAGRKRFNVLGALNFITKKMEIVTNDTYITATQIVQMFEMLSLLHPGKIINVILDNARYQKCSLVFEAAEKYGINLIYLPTYSPNLNLIERVWKFVKSRVLNAAYKESFEEFCNSITKCTENLHEDFRDDMLSLITDKFQILGY